MGWGSYFGTIQTLQIRKTTPPHQLASSKIRSRCPPQGRHGNHDDS
jgi:hypothetical protein